jgi:predicted MFS family arabinose efflux permease
MSEAHSSTADQATVLTMPPVNTASFAMRWYVLVMMCLVYTLSIADRYVVSTVLDPIRQDLHLSNAGVAWLTAWPLALFYVLMGFPLSWAIDRYSRRKIIAACLVVWSVMTTLCGLAHSTLQFFFTRVGVGIGEAGGTPGANSLLSDYFPASRRAMALTVFSLGAPFGAYIGYHVAGTINDHYGWRAVFLALGVPGVLAGIAIWASVREPRRGCLDAGDDEQTPSFSKTLKFWWSQRSAVHLVIGSAVCALWGWGLIYWTQVFVQRTYHLSPGEASNVTDLAHLVGGSAATIATGWLMARPVMADSRRIMWLLAAGTAVATIASGVAYYTRDLVVAKIMFWIFIPAIYFYIGPCFGLLNNLAQCRMRAMFCAMTLFLANVGNLLITPPLIGSLTDWFARMNYSQADALRLAMLCIVPTGLWAALHYVIAARDIRKDEVRARSFPF